MHNDQFQPDSDVTLFLPADLTEKVYEDHNVPVACRGEAMRVLGLQSLYTFPANSQMAMNLHDSELRELSYLCRSLAFAANQELMATLKLTFVTPNATTRLLRQLHPPRPN